MRFLLLVCLFFVGCSSKEIDKVTCDAIKFIVLEKTKGNDPQQGVAKLDTLDIDNKRVLLPLADKDSWGTELVAGIYVDDFNNVDPEKARWMVIISCGPDKEIGTDDDISTTKLDWKDPKSLELWLFDPQWE